MQRTPITEFCAPSGISGLPEDKEWHKQQQQNKTKHAIILVATM